ncbi:carph-isopro domain-containing protein [Paracoccus thiocyanatus]|uniref:carph-isopro domain-containing protein n=1 Tax=Paracoccus thiocyanatus TaxID=34006 RepID=UPI0035ABF213
MSYVSNIVAAFGGIRPMAKALGRSSSTIHGWKDRGSIPDAEKPVVLAAALRVGVTISRDDFWPGGSSTSEDAA